LTITSYKNISPLIIGLAVMLLACQGSNTKGNMEGSTLFDLGRSIGTIQSPTLDEASGLACSISNDGFIWSHNDSGGEAMLYLLSLGGEESGKFLLPGITNIDWEDLAIGLGPQISTNYLYIGDIGDNRAIRKSYSIYRFEEPDLNSLDLPSNSSVEEFSTIQYVYEDGARDAETLMIDPVSRDLFIVSKRGQNSFLYKLPFPQDTIEMDTALRVGILPFTYTTGGDISGDGTEVLLKNYKNIFYWRRENKESLEDLLQTSPIVLKYLPEPQGEAIAFKADGTSFFTVSEQVNQKEVEILHYSRN
jgi:hypothetical protein